MNGQLFDLQQDPGEKNNLSKQHPDIVKRLRQDYLNWLKDVSAGQSFDRPRIEVGRDDENPVEFQTSWATLSDDQMQYTFQAYDWDSIQGWNEPGDSVTWEIDVKQPGTYEVRVTYGAPAAKAGGRFRVSIGSAQVDGTIEPTPVPDAFIQRSVGNITVPSGESTLKIEALEPVDGELMVLNHVQLRRLETSKTP